MITHIWLWLITAVCLILMTIRDLKYHKMPSAFTSAIILFLVCANLMINPSLIWYGIASFVFAWFLYDADVFQGIADIKGIVIVGLLLRSPLQFFAFMVILLFVWLAYQFLIIKIIKKGDEPKNLKDLLSINNPAPFIPALTLTYIILFVISYFK